MLLVCLSGFWGAGCRGELADDLRDLLGQHPGHGTGGTSTPGTCGNGGAGGGPAVDAGQPAPDAGQPAPDAGQPATDGGEPAPDAGQPATDGGSPSPGDIPAPRLIAPLSGALSTTAQPQFSWINSGTPGAVNDALVEVCADRACTNIITTIAAQGDHTYPPNPLPPGHVFWRARSTRAGVVGTTTTPVWELFLPHRFTLPSRQIATRADFDGDGYTDFVLEGRVLRGGPAGYAGSIDIPAGPANATLEQYAVAGDLDGDGFTDLLRIDQTAEGDYAAVGLWTPVPLFGGPAGFTAGSAQIGTGPSGSFYEVRPAGDVNGDGHADVVFKSRFDLQTWDGLSFGIGTAAAPFMLTTQGYFASDGDVNGDGYADAASNSNGEMAFDVTFGGVLGFGGEPTIQKVPLSGQPVIGSIAMLDANGDAFSDVALTMADSVELFAGSEAGVATSPFAAIPGTYPVAVGSADFNGDGQADVVVKDGAALAVHYGHAGEPDVTGVALVTTETPVVDASAGSFGDVNGDGYDDLTVGVMALDPSDQRYHVRAAVLYLGGPDGLDPTGAPAM